MVVFQGVWRCAGTRLSRPAFVVQARDFMAGGLQVAGTPAYQEEVSFRRLCRLSLKTSQATLTHQVCQDGAGALQFGLP